MAKNRDVIKPEGWNYDFCNKFVKYGKCLMYSEGKIVQKCSFELTELCNGRFLTDDAVYNRVKKIPEIVPVPVPSKQRTSAIK